MAQRPVRRPRGYIALAAEHQRGQLRAVVAGRDAIRMAEGILMQQQQITEQIALWLIDDAGRDARARRLG